MSSLKLSAQLRRFLITGITATLIDLACYASLLYLEIGNLLARTAELSYIDHPEINFIVAKTLSFLCAVSFAYLGHRSWTFMSHGSKSRLAGFISLYISALIINNAVNLYMLGIVGTERMGIGIAFIVATGITASLNFTVMKFLIFRPTVAKNTNTSN